MDSQKFHNWVKRVLIINGIIDLLIGVSMLFGSKILATAMGFADFTDTFRFLAGGWGIAALSFGITRIWVGRGEKFIWPTVVIGLFEGTSLSIFCVILMIFTNLTALNVLIPLIIGLSFMILYGTLLIMKDIKNF